MTDTWECEQCNSEHPMSEEPAYKERYPGAAEIWLCEECVY